MISCTTIQVYLEWEDGSESSKAVASLPIWWRLWTHWYIFSSYIHSLWVLVTQVHRPMLSPVYKVWSHLSPVSGSVPHYGIGMSLRNLEIKGEFISWPWPTCLLHPPSPFWLVVWRCKVAGHSLPHAFVGTLALGRHSPLVPPQMSSLPHSGPAPAAWESRWSSYLWAFDLSPLPHHSWAHMLLKIVTWLYLWIFSTKTILVNL